MPSMLNTITGWRYWQGFAEQRGKSQWFWLAKMEPAPNMCWKIRISNCFKSAPNTGSSWPRDAALVDYVRLLCGLTIPMQHLPGRLLCGLTIPTQHLPGRLLCGLTIPTQHLPGRLLCGLTIPTQHLPGRLLCGLTIPTQHLPGRLLCGLTIPTQHLPGRLLCGLTIPTQHLPGRLLCGLTIPTQHLPGRFTITLLFNRWHNRREVRLYQKTIRLRHSVKYTHYITTNLRNWN